MDSILATKTAIDNISLLSIMEKVGHKDEYVCECQRKSLPVRVRSKFSTTNINPKKQIASICDYVIMEIKWAEKWV